MCLTFLAKIDFLTIYDQDLLLFINLRIEKSLRYILEFISNDSILFIKKKVFCKKKINLIIIS